MRNFIRTTLTLGCLGFAACSGCENERPPPRAMDKEGIQRRSDKTNNDLGREEDRSKERKAQEE